MDKPRRRKREPKNPWSKLLQKLRSSAKCSYKKGSRHHEKKIITVTPAELAAIFERQHGRCYWLGTKIDPEGIYVAWNHLAPSLDRLDNTKPYSAENVVITTRFANLGRGRLSVGQMKPVALAIRKAISLEMWPKYLFNETT